MFELENKVAFITGGLGGIGLGFAKSLLKNGLKGVTLVDLDSEKSNGIIENLNGEFGEGKSIFIPVDIRNSEKVIEAFEKTIKMFKHLDIVINCAGVLDEENTQRCVDVNFVATFKITKLAMEDFLPKFKSSDEGIVLNVSSVTGVYAFAPIPLYSATKSAIVAMGLSYGNKHYYNKCKVKILTVCPGRTISGMRMNNELWNVPHIKAMLDEDPIDRIQTVEEISEKIIPVLRNGSTGSVWILEGGSDAFEHKLKRRDDL